MHPKLCFHILHTFADFNIRHGNFPSIKFFAFTGFFILLWQKHPGSPKQQNEKSGTKPPLPINPSQFRKGAYHESLDFVLTLCETSFGLVDVFPVEDRKDALHEVISLDFPLMFSLSSASDMYIFFVIPVFQVTCRDQFTFNRGSQYWRYFLTLNGSS